MRFLPVLFLLISVGLPLFPADGSYLIPQRVFVGDRGQLVFPLGGAFAGVPETLIDSPEFLPRLPDLVIFRVELENRGGAPRLLIDFTAYTPGVIELPPIEIASFVFTDLRVEIGSILAGEDDPMVLSGPASFLPAPGTTILIYGTVMGFILLILGVIAGMIWGVPGLRRFLEKTRRRWLIGSMKRILWQLQDLQAKRGSAGDGEIVARLSAEFRTFLCLVTGINCRVLVPREFLSLSIPGAGADRGAADSGALSGEFLRDFFSRCDTLRFSGMAIGAGDVRCLLDGAAIFIKALEGAGRNRPAGGKGL
ncbi:MAG: hypothetical protein LBD78_06110 [Spirochaetaceae bacterium]|nr:hypothetical protein [Spirochaetaceae bacterium]